MKTTEKDLSLEKNLWHPFGNIENDIQNEFEFWTLDECGNIGRPDRCYFEISADRLLEQNWLTHEISKERQPGTKSAESEFYFVFMQALRRAGYKRLIIDLENPYAQLHTTK